MLCRSDSYSSPAPYTGPGRHPPHGLACLTRSSSPGWHPPSGPECTSYRASSAHGPLSLLPYDFSTKHPPSGLFFPRPGHLAGAEKDMGARSPVHHGYPFHHTTTRPGRPKRRPRPLLVRRSTTGSRPAYRQEARTTRPGRDTPALDCLYLSLDLRAAHPAPTRASPGSGRVCPVMSLRPPGQISGCLPAYPATLFPLSLSC